MSDIYRNGRFENDDWRVPADDETPGEGEAVIVPLARFVTERADWLARPGRLGLLVGPADKVDAVAGDLGRFAVIAVEFPKFNDGRGFSHARYLSERMGYTGEIRAVGEVLLDQIPLMMRVGITAFRIGNAPTRRELEAGNMPAVPYFYQPAADDATRAGDKRHWFRRAG